MAVSPWPSLGAWVRGLFRPFRPPEEEGVEGLFSYREDEAIERPFRWPQLVRLLSYLRPYRGWATLAAAVTLAGAAVQLARPYLLMLVVDDALGRKDVHRLWAEAALYLASYVISWLTSAWQMSLTARVGQSAIRDMRRHLYAHLQGLSLSFFESRPAGSILVRVTNDVNSLSDLFTNGIVNLLTNVFLLAGIATVMLLLRWDLALVCFSILPILMALSTGLRRRIRLGWQMVRRRLSRLNAHLNEAIQGIRVTQAFVREEENARFFRRLNRDYYRTWMDTQRSSALFAPLLNLTGSVGTALVFLYGAILLHEKATTVGLVVAFSQYVALFWQPISLLGNLYNSLLMAMASSERIFQFLDMAPTVQDVPGAITLGRVRGEVVFDHVSFAYPGERAALEDVSFRVEPGQTVALVGPTGAGKTTVVALLARFYDPERGRILVDGKDLRSLRLSWWRSQLGMVLQETFLFSDTVAGNLRLGRPSAAMEEVRRAAREAGLDPYVAELPQGYETQVEERGSRLSAGQRQLLAIGRALLANPRVLILDEATSSVDSETERVLQAALAKLLRGRTAFVVAHRLSTVMQADLILVLDRGRVVEMGTHASLMDRGGLYARLVRAQRQALEGRPIA